MINSINNDEKLNQMIKSKKIPNNFFFYKSGVFIVGRILTTSWEGELSEMPCLIAKFQGIFW